MSRVRSSQLVPFRDILSIQDGFFEEMARQFDSMFAEAFSGIREDSGFGAISVKKAAYPKVDVYESEVCVKCSDDEVKKSGLTSKMVPGVVIEAAVPGLQEKDIDVLLEETDTSRGMFTLSIRTNKQERQSVKDDQYICRELRKSSSSRSFEVDGKIFDIENISVVLDKLGRLVVSLPKRDQEKKEDKQRVRKLEIDTAA